MQYISYQLFLKINIFDTNCYLQVKSKQKTIKTYLQLISINKIIFNKENYLYYNFYTFR